VWRGGGSVPPILGHSAAVVDRVGACVRSCTTTPSGVRASPPFDHCPHTPAPPAGPNPIDPHPCTSHATETAPWRRPTHTRPIVAAPCTRRRSATPGAAPTRAATRTVAASRARPAQTRRKPLRSRTLASSTGAACLARRIGCANLGSVRVPITYPSQDVLTSNIEYYIGFALSAAIGGLVGLYHKQIVAYLKPATLYLHECVLWILVPL
jgi:hypothetical protein